MLTEPAPCLNWLRDLSEDLRTRIKPLKSDTNRAEKEYERNKPCLPRV